MFSYDQCNPAFLIIQSVLYNVLRVSAVLENSGCLSLNTPERVDCSGNFDASDLHCRIQCRLSSTNIEAHKALFAEVHLHGLKVSKY